MSSELELRALRRGRYKVPALVIVVAHGYYGDGCYGDGYYRDGCYGDGCYGDGCYGDGCYGDGYVEGCYGDGNGDDRGGYNDMPF